MRTQEPQCLLSTIFAGFYLLLISFSRVVQAQTETPVNTSEIQTKAGARNSKLGLVLGKVIDEKTGEILTGISVSVEEAGIQVQSDGQGRFNIQLKPGTYTLVFKSINYK